jgi:hypothetical protein
MGRRCEKGLGDTEDQELEEECIEWSLMEGNC